MPTKAVIFGCAGTQLGAAEREVVFAAALLHDVAKPLCTKVEFDGRVTSRGHSVRRRVMA